MSSSQATSNQSLRELVGSGVGEGLRKLAVLAAVSVVGVLSGPSTADAQPPPAVPSLPTGLAVSSASHDSVVLVWDDPGDATIESYQVLRRSRDGSVYGDGLGALEFVVIVDDTGSAATTYTDTSVTPCTRYVYRIKARNAQGLSGRASYANAETGDAPDPSPTDGELPGRVCRDPNDPPTPTAVAVTAVPIVVESTTADYFVLYASYVLDGTTVEYPVQVIRGADGTTTLAENVAALPVERYRVEKYLVADPADVDGDRIDDITELSSLGAMNPVNPGRTLEISEGAVSIPDRQTFETLSYKGTNVLPNENGLDNQGHIKFIVLTTDTHRPVVYFQNTNTYRLHQPFTEPNEILSHPEFDVQSRATGAIVYHPNLVAPDGSLGVYRLQYQTDFFEFEAGSD